VEILRPRTDFGILFLVPIVGNLRPIGFTRNRAIESRIGKQLSDFLRRVGAFSESRMHRFLEGFRICQKVRISQITFSIRLRLDFPKRGEW